MTATSVNRVFTKAVVPKRNARTVTCRYFVLAAEPKMRSWFGHGKTYICKSVATWSRLFEHSTGDSTWISTNAEHTQDLLRAAVVFSASHHNRKTCLGNLLMFQSPKAESLPAIRTLFRNIVGDVRAFRLLVSEELADVLLAPTDEARDLFIGGLYDPGTKHFHSRAGTLKRSLFP